MKVAIRVDASQEIGTGHLRRSIALAEALAAMDADIRFVVRDLGLETGAILSGHGFAFDQLARPDQTAAPDPAITHAHWAGVDPMQDADQTAQVLCAGGLDWVVIDSYAFDGRWHSAVRAALRCRIAQIDDIADRRIAPDLLVDHTNALDHAAKYRPALMTPAVILGGPRYALLSRRYAAARRYAFSEHVRSIGVFMGGIDAGNFSAAVLDAVAQVGFAGAVEIVTTGFNPHLRALSERVGQRARAGLETRLTLDLPDLAEFFAQHDIQVGAGGGASWERCCIGAPTLLVPVAVNQNEVIPRLAEQRVVVAAASPCANEIAAELAILLEAAGKRRDMAAKGRALVDGRGAMRVAEAMQTCA